MNSERGDPKLGPGEPTSEDDAESSGEHPSGFRQRAALPTANDTDASALRPRPRGGWTLIDQYERDGFCYQLLRRPRDVEAARRLTRREREVLEHARRGHGNKSIAQALGLSPSTVGVLLFRAGAKLRAKSRAELLSVYERMKDGH